MVKSEARFVVIFALAACLPHEPAKSTSAVVPADCDTHLYRTMVYSASFAERFKLDQAGTKPLDWGLYAVALRVVQEPGQAPRCFLDLYLDDSLDLAFPDGDEGVARHRDADDPYFFVHDSHQLGRESDRWYQMLGSFHAVACRTDPRNCLVNDGGPWAFARHLMPGVAYFSYDLTCHVLDPAKGPTEMWLLRSGKDAKELDAASTDETASYRFNMPAPLFEHAAVQTRRAAHAFDSPLPPEPARGYYSVPGVKAGP